MIPLTVTNEEYLVDKIYPSFPNAWIDEKKTKIGYEISMTKYFFRYSPLESVYEVVKRIETLEESISSHMKTLFGEGGTH